MLKLHCQMKREQGKGVKQRSGIIGFKVKTHSGCRMEKGRRESRLEEGRQVRR